MKNPHKIVAINSVEGTFMDKTVFWMILCIIIGSVFNGCAGKDTEKGKDCPVDFTIINNKDLPQEIRDAISEKEQEEFQMSCQWEDQLYLMKGYGIQSTGGYSIQVEYVTENAKEIHIKTRLIGPETREEQSPVVSSPYLVVKVENREKTIIFD